MFVTEKGRYVPGKASLAEMLSEVGPGELAVADGAICPQMVRCGKARWKCARGELHGPYYYRFMRDKYGRLRKQYVRRSEVEAWRDLCERRREWLAERVAIRALCRRVVTRGGRVNWAVCFALEAAAEKMTQDVTPDGGLRRGLITCVRDAAAFTDAAIKIRRARD